MKQAVLVIHGIGEQRPMDTLRSFARAVWSTDTSLHKDHPNAGAMWSKPYELSENFELRRLTTPENIAGIRTDFFEFYWAHMMSGNKLSHVTAWLRTLLFRSPSTIPQHLVLTYRALVAVVIATVGIACWLAYARATDQPPVAWRLSLLFSAIVLPGAYWVIGEIVGDAARYLDAAPPNIQRRHEIRSAAVATLKSLHERGYERIIVVGHSLGTVIGYDMLTYAWPAFNAEAPTSAVPCYDALYELERLASRSADPSKTTPEQWQVAQRKYFNELKANGSRWRVTDFVTMGSPLAHAEVLLARNAAELNPKFEARELPKAPPVLEGTLHQGQVHAGFSYPYPSPQPVPHHAAMFGPTRWTNLYFPNRALIRGDLVGGPIRRIFGAAINDKSVSTRIWKGLLSHTFYWEPEPKGDIASKTVAAGEDHVQVLRNALDLADTKRA